MIMKRVYEIIALSSFLAILILTNRNTQLVTENAIQAEIIDTLTLPEECTYIKQITAKEQEEEIATEIYYGELELLALLVQAEAGNQDETGKRYVADVVLNRVDSPDFPDTIEEVIYQKKPVQFAVTVNGGIEKAGYTITDDVYKIVLEESENRTNPDIVYFRTKKYHKVGRSAFKHQDHYFSTK